MKVTIEVNSLSEIHGFTQDMSEVEIRVIAAISKKAIKEMLKHDAMIEYHKNQANKIAHMKNHIDMILNNNPQE